MGAGELEPTPGRTQQAASSGSFAVIFSFQALETVPGAELCGPQDGNKHDLNNPRLAAGEDRQENYPLGKGTSEHVTRGIRVHQCLSVPWRCSPSPRPWPQNWRDADSNVEMMEVRVTGQI